MTGASFIDAFVDFHVRFGDRYRSEPSIVPRHQVPSVTQEELEVLLKLGESYYSHENCTNDDSAAHSWFRLLRHFYVAAQQLLSPAFKGRTLGSKIEAVPPLDGRDWPEKVRVLLDLQHAFLILESINAPSELQRELPKIFNYVRSVSRPDHGLQTEQLVLCALLETWYQNLCTRLPIEELALRPQITRLPFATGMIREVPLRFDSPLPYTLQGRHDLPSPDPCLAQVSLNVPGDPDTPVLEVTFTNRQRPENELVFPISVAGFKTSRLTLSLSDPPEGEPTVSEDDLKSWFEQGTTSIAKTDRGVIIHLPEGNLHDVSEGNDQSWLKERFEDWKTQLRFDPVGPLSPSEGTIILQRVPSASHPLRINRTGVPTWDVSVVGFLEWKFPGIGGTDAAFKDLCNLITLLKKPRQQAFVLTRTAQELSDHGWFLDRRAWTRIFRHLDRYLGHELKEVAALLDQNDLAVLKAVLDLTAERGSSPGVSLGEISKRLAESNENTRIDFSDLLKRINQLDRTGWLETEDTNRRPEKYFIPESVQPVVATVARTNS